MDNLTITPTPLELAGKINEIIAGKVDNNEFSQYREYMSQGLRPYLTLIEEQYWGEEEFIKLIDRTTSLKELPPSVYNIGISAFDGCSNLALTSLPDNVTSIDHFAFFGCSNLQLTSLPPKLRSIGYAAFQNCTGLTTLSIGEQTQTIASNAFNNCKNLTLIRITIISSPDSFKGAPWGAANATIEWIIRYT